MSKTLFGVALIALASHAVAATQYLRIGKLIDGKGKMWTNVAVVVENDRIRGVEPDGPPPLADNPLDIARHIRSCVVPNTSNFHLTNRVGRHAGS
jgi:hypothetical protein